MPLYEYACRDCHRHFERLVRAFGEQVACPHCASADVEKQLSTFAMSVSGGRSTPEPAFSGGCARQGGSCGCGAGGCAH